MNHERISVAVRQTFIGALMIGLAGCGSSDTAADLDGDARPVEDVDASAEQAQVEQDEDSDSAPPGGGGAGSIVVDGIAYEFAAERCFTDSGFLQISGPGVTADGVPFYANISANSDEDMDDDGALDTSADVTLEIGAEGAFDQSPNEMSSFSASAMDSAAFAFAEFEYEVSDDRQIVGSGEIRDTNYVAAPSGELLPFEFSGSCG